MAHKDKDRTFGEHKTAIFFNTIGILCIPWNGFGRPPELDSGST